MDGVGDGSGGLLWWWWVSWGVVGCWGGKD